MSRAATETSSGEEPRLAGEVCRGRPDHPAQALGQVRSAGGDRTRRLQREQRVAVGQRHDPLELVGSEARGGADQVAHVVRSQGREVDLADRYPAPRQPVKQRIHVGAAGRSRRVSTINIRSRGSRRAT